jgi:hypothetical protein
MLGPPPARSPGPIFGDRFLRPIRGSGGRKPDRLEQKRVMWGISCMNKVDDVLSVGIPSNSEEAHHGSKPKLKFLAGRGARRSLRAKVLTNGKPE